MGKETERRAFDELERLIKAKFKAGSEQHLELSNWKAQWWDLREKEESSEGLSPNDEYQKRRVLSGLNQLALTVAGKAFPELTTTSPTPVLQRKTTSNHRVFISHARADFDTYVHELTRLLDENKVAYWLDRDDLPVGQDWDVEIDKALASCDRMIVCITPHALTRRNVRTEWQRMLAHKKLVIPLIFEMPEELPSHLALVNYLDATTAEKRVIAFQKLVRLLQ